MFRLPVVGCLGRGLFISDTKHNIKQYLMYQIRIVYRIGIVGAAAQPFRGTRPLLQGECDLLCRSGLVPRKGRRAPPSFLKAKKSPGPCRGFLLSACRQPANRLSYT
ncbi:hypothetical protein DMX06_11255 [Pseudomonas mosselii]|nr:hypothetical protein DMX06_11255 [Pseudomonas mosselii]